MFRLSPFLLSPLLRSVASGGSVGGGANALPSGGRTTARRVQRDEGIDDALALHLARHSVKYEGCRANRFHAEEGEGEADPWTSWVAAQATTSSAAASSASAGGGGRRLEQDEPASRGTVTFRLCNKDNGFDSSSSDTCDNCVSEHGSVEIDMEAYLRSMVEWEYERQGTYCEECYACTSGGNFNSPEIPCHLIDTSTCYDECQRIENMEENGYLDAAEFVECTLVYAPTGGEEVYAAAACDESSGKINIGVFIDERCTAPDETKSVEDYLHDGDGASLRLSHALLKRTYDRSGCVAECLDEDRADGIGVPVVERVCEDLWRASSLGRGDHAPDPHHGGLHAPTLIPTQDPWYAPLNHQDQDQGPMDQDHASDPHHGGLYTPAPTSPPCIYQNKNGTWFAGLDCEYPATSVCEDQPPGTAIPNFCTNNGNCLPHDFFVSGQFCDCPPGFWGERCELAEYWVEEEEHWGEEDDHGWEDHDHEVHHDHVAGAPDCFVTRCGPNSSADAYAALLEMECVVDCSSPKCGDYFLRLRGALDLCDPGTHSLEVVDGFYDLEEACAMHTCNYVDHGGPGGWEQGHDDVYDPEGEESWNWDDDEDGVDDDHGAPDCPQVNCDDGGMEAYISLRELGCIRDCASSECREHFLLLRGVHDLCDHDALPAAAEDSLHNFEEACAMHTCSQLYSGGPGWGEDHGWEDHDHDDHGVHYDYVAGAPDCFVTRCDPDSGAAAYSALLEIECMVDCFKPKCGDYFLQLRGALDLCDPDTLSQEVVDGFYDLEEVCAMHACNYPDHGQQWGWDQGHSGVVTDVVVVEDQDLSNSLWTDKDILLNYTARDRRALEIFYRLGQGYSWMNSEGWLSGQSVCKWHGVTCDEGGSVTSLQLHGNSISASIFDLYNAALSRLANLTSLDLSNNQIFGTIPERFGTDLPRLSELNLGNNQLAGSVPNSLSRLSKLNVLELRENDFSWIMMNNGYSSLGRLDLGDNQFSGTIQYDLARLPTLEYVVLSGNRLMGGLPPDYSLLAKLQVFDISRNQITGSLPYSGFAANSELRQLNLSKNNLRGTINSDILDNAMESNEGLYHLDLSFNQLDGTVPNFDVDMLNIDVAGNMLAGINPMACDRELWNDGAVGAYLCDGIACRPGTANSVGRQTSAGDPCVPCNETSYYGAIGCFEEEEEFYEDDDVDVFGSDDFLDDAFDDDRVCPLSCQNGGSCSVRSTPFGTEYWCRCPGRYTGKLCESELNYRPSFVQVVSPVRLTKKEGYDHQVALFGPLTFTGSANIYYAGSQLCNEIDYNLEWKPPFFLLVDRGGCTFVSKVRHAQWIDAEAVVFADNTCLCEAGDACTPGPEDATCETEPPILADDGSGSDINIPSLLLLKQDADLIKEELISGNEVAMELNMGLKSLYQPTPPPSSTSSSEYQPTPPPSSTSSLDSPTSSPLVLSMTDEEGQSAVAVPSGELARVPSSSVQPSIAPSTASSMTPSTVPTEMPSTSQAPTSTATDPEPDFVATSNYGQTFSLHWLFLAIAIFFTGATI